ncbi:MAG: bifunctional riboflavin kinase/FAD synthetase [Sulfurovum sp.]|nr:bifunctional riboflavin kinase/FAD synthetase [Sulfurovum sp.]
MPYNNSLTSIAIGSFDGIHIAHQTLIDKADALVIIERNGGYLTPGFKRSYFTSKVCCFYHFDVIKGLTPEDFVAKLQEDFPLLTKIVVGYDFHFGKNKAGDAETLKRLFSGEVEIVQEVSVQGVPVHSRTIKAYVKEGNIEMANALLGRRYNLEGQVIRGQGLGKKQLVPTLNLFVQEYVLPKEGVYATVTTTNTGVYHSVSFLGHRVSTDGSYAVETHILEVDLGEVKGLVQLDFVSFLRDNKKFESLDVLKDQITIDILSAKKALG